MEIEDIIEDFSAQREKAIRGHPVDWASFCEWEKRIKKEIVVEGFVPYEGFRNFVVVIEKNPDDIAIYADGKYDEKKPFDGNNVRRVYINSYENLETARENCDLLNRGDEIEMVRAYALKIKKQIYKNNELGFLEHCRLINEE